MRRLDLIEAPELKRANVVTTVLQTVTAPGHAFRDLAGNPRPFRVLACILGLSVGATLLTGPVVTRLLLESLEVGASAHLANQFVLAQAFVLTPLGTTAFLGLVSLFVWGLVLILGGEVSGKAATAIVFASGIAGVLKRFFIAGVLYLRWWLNPSRLGADVTTGLDGFIDQETMGGSLSLFSQQLGLFDVWFFVLIGLGLRHGARLSLRHSIVTTSVTMVLVTLTRMVLAYATG